MFHRPYLLFTDLSGSAEGNVTTLDNMFVYVPATRKWTRKADMYEGSNGLSTAVMNNRIYICVRYSIHKWQVVYYRGRSA